MLILDFELFSLTSLTKTPDKEYIFNVKSFVILGTSIVIVLSVIVGYILILSLLIFSLMVAGN